MAVGTEMSPFDMAVDGAPLRKAFSTSKPNRANRSPSPVAQKSMLLPQQQPARQAQPPLPALQPLNFSRPQPQQPLYVPFQQSASTAPYKVDGLAELTSSASAPSPRPAYPNHPDSPQRTANDSMFRTAVPAAELARPASPAAAGGGQSAAKPTAPPFGANTLFKASDVGNMVMQQQTSLQVAQMAEQMNLMLAEMTALRATVAELQVQVQCGKAQAQSHAVAQSEARGTMKETAQQLKDAMQESVTDVKELIAVKDAQQKARLFNSFSTRDRDVLERVPNDAGEVPVRFPTTRKDLTAMSLDTMQYLFDFYQLPQEPRDSLYDRLMQHLGVRV